jgi:hypothetical protein
MKPKVIARLMITTVFILQVSSINAQASETTSSLANPPDEPPMDMRMQIVDDLKSYLSSMDSQDFVTAVMYMPACQFEFVDEERIIAALERAAALVPLQIKAPMITGSEFHEFSKVWYAKIDARVKMMVQVSENISVERLVQLRDAMAELYGDKNVEIREDGKTMDIKENASYYAVYEHNRWRFIKADMATEACIPHEVKEHCRGE